MLHTAQNFIPVLTSEAGLCLTAANWQEANADLITYYLDSLLLKPGSELLKNIPDFATYMGWSGKKVINAARLKVNKEGMITFSSPFDGSKHKLSFAELFVIILKLKPDAVLFPNNTLRHFPEIWSIWDDSITPFLSEDDLLQQEISRPHGVYLCLEHAGQVEKLSTWSHLPRYIFGTISLDLIKLAKEKGIEFIESDEPARLAMQGQVYSGDTLISLGDAAATMQFEPIDTECTCPTCAQKLTKAYLHHLLLHTPLLCQRFLIQHNVHKVLQGK